jgi:hypothetical protein
MPRRLSPSRRSTGHLYYPLCLSHLVTPQDLLLVKSPWLWLAPVRLLTCPVEKSGCSPYKVATSLPVVSLVCLVCSCVENLDSKKNSDKNSTQLDKKTKREAWPEVWRGGVAARPNPSPFLMLLDVPWYPGKNPSAPFTSISSCCQIFLWFLMLVVGECTCSTGLCGFGWLPYPLICAPWFVLVSSIVGLLD